MTEKRLTPVARNLRRRSTEAESRLLALPPAPASWKAPSSSANSQSARHVADFACRAAHLAIELDGGQHTPEADSPKNGRSSKRSAIVSFDSGTTTSSKTPKGSSRSSARSCSRPATARTNPPSPPGGERSSWRGRPGEKVPCQRVLSTAEPPHPTRGRQATLSPPGRGGDVAPPPITTGTAC